MGISGTIVRVMVSDNRQAKKMAPKISTKNQFFYIIGTRMYVYVYVYVCVCIYMYIYLYTPNPEPESPKPEARLFISLCAQALSLR